MKKLRIGIIGAGAIAQNRHIPAFLTLSDQVSITGICDVNESVAHSVAKKFEIAMVTKHYRDLFKKVDAIVICTPNKFHAEIAIAALEAGIHVLCEKPMAMSFEESKNMSEAAKRSGCILAIAYHYRFMKESQAAKRLIAANEIGQPFVARVQALRRRKVPGWGVFTNKELQGGGSLIDYGCHFLDLALWLLGNPEPIEVLGSTYNQLSRMPNQINLWGSYDHHSFDVDDHATAYITFHNGASMLFETSWSANIKSDQENISISGQAGGIDLFPFQWNQAKHGMLLNSQAEWIPGDEDPSLLQAQNFIDSCFGKNDFMVDYHEALQVTKIIDAIYKSSEAGKSIRLKGD